MRRRLLVVTASVVALAAVVGGIGYTAVTVNAADRDAGAPVWRFPKEKSGDGKAAGKKGDDKAGSSSKLGDMLLPYGTDGYTRGPDIDEFGADAELNGRKATALHKESIRDLPRTQRRQLEKEIDKQRIQGMAMRSYLSTDAAYNSTAYADSAFTVSVVLSQMENKQAVREIVTFQNEFFNALKIFRKGPEIKGHKNAECFLPPTDKDEKLDMMLCSAYVGDIQVTATAYGVKPLDKGSVAKMLAEQLDRISEPGEAV
ncbi:hypothetical protein ABT009_35660 [Streptomyces sp. NPDC002896]|uniref:hypothetical protein n=1 Tax=Streptomyces sp. NPDC002896 TaxID=3154438 RepID=UPI00331B4E48